MASGKIAKRRPRRKKTMKNFKVLFVINLPQSPRIGLIENLMVLELVYRMLNNKNIESVSLAVNNSLSVNPAPVKKKIISSISHGD